mmetsp:Transcript_26497/g.76560  ORF Transcript_26497/g.76560 Transcript_26497/m.76560 type:complete len:245 (+) Transcript_26497:1018-1752(+)
MNGVDSSVELASAWAACELSVTLQRQGHHNFFKRRVTRTFSDAIDSAFKLTSTVQGTCQGVCGGKTKIILAMRAENYSIGSFDIFSEQLDEVTEFPWHVPSSGIRDIQGSGSSFDNCRKNLVEKFRVRASSIFRREFDIITAKTFCKGDSVYSNFNDLFWCFIEFRLHMNFTSGNEGMDSGSLGTFDSVPSSFNVLGICSRKTTNYWNISIFKNFVPNLIGNILDRCKVIRRGNRKSSFDDVDT